MVREQFGFAVRETLGMHVALRMTLTLMLPLLAGCLAPTGPRRVLSRSPIPPRAIIVVLDGAGGTVVTSRALEDVIAEQRLPFEVIPYDWSHGYGRIIADQVDVCHLDRQAEEFARFLRTLRVENPGLPVHVLTYSAGSAVVVRGARFLPPNALERVVLLAPAVAATSDLRPLLSAACQGVDVFVSDRDLFFLGIATTVVGTTGGSRGPAAGRVGFEPILESQCDANLYRTRLRYFPWTPDYCWTGNYGQHDGGHRPAFLAAYVVQRFLGGNP